jgi:hypothetical protein
MWSAPNTSTSSGVARLDQVEVLVDRIGGAEKPLRAAGGICGGTTVTN